MATKTALEMLAEDAVLFEPSKLFLEFIQWTRRTIGTIVQTGGMANKSTVEHMMKYRFFDELPRSNVEPRTVTNFLTDQNLRWIENDPTIGIYQGATVLDVRNRSEHGLCEAYIAIRGELGWRTVRYDEIIFGLPKVLNADLP